jgi:DNA repair protein RadC
MVARELVKRWLGEVLKHGNALNSPSSVREYLRIHFAGREYESFVTLFLDAQNRLIAAEELFRERLPRRAYIPRDREGRLAP